MINFLLNFVLSNPYTTFLVILPVIFVGFQLVVLRDIIENGRGYGRSDDYQEWLTKGIGSGIFYPITISYYFFSFIFWLPSVVSRTMECRNCRRTIKSNSAFCNKCGVSTSK